MPIDPVELSVVVMLLNVCCDVFQHSLSEFAIEFGVLRLGTLSAIIPACSEKYCIIARQERSVQLTAVT
jgi:hypothetical protein